jgi:hypothetical protein
VKNSTIVPEVVEDELDPAQLRQSLILLYRQRLARLLALEMVGKPELQSAEQRQLHSRSVLSTVRALTEMGDGSVASQLLRQAHRP